MLDAFTWYKQSAILWRGAKVVYIDPWDVPEDEPKADAILITHAHFDHFQPDQISNLVKPGTVILAPEDCAAELSAGDVRGVKPGQTGDVLGISYQTIAAYNAKPERLEMHPRDNNWVGYVLDLGGTKTYLAGDTDHVPEMGGVKADVAFVPIGGTYTMDVDEAAGAVREIAPRIAVPYHFGFVVGSPELGPQFVEKIAPIEGRVLTPVHKYEQ